MPDAQKTKPVCVQDQYAETFSDTFAFVIFDSTNDRDGKPNVIGKIAFRGIRQMECYLQLAGSGMIRVATTYGSGYKHELETLVEAAKQHLAKDCDNKAIAAKLYSALTCPAFGSWDARLGQAGFILFQVV